MPVVVKKVGILPGYGEIISIAHYGEQNGDLMADPEMEFTIIGGDYYPISFRNDYLGKHSSVFEDDGINLPLQYDLTTFTNQWMRNIAEQQNFAEIDKLLLIPRQKNMKPEKASLRDTPPPP